MNEKALKIYVTLDTNKIMEVFDDDELIYARNEKYTLLLGGNNSQNYSQTSDSAVGFYNDC